MTEKLIKELTENVEELTENVEELLNKKKDDKQQLNEIRRLLNDAMAKPDQVSRALRFRSEITDVRNVPQHYTCMICLLKDNEAERMIIADRYCLCNKCIDACYEIIHSADKA